MSLPSETDLSGADEASQLYLSAHAEDKVRQHLYRRNSDGGRPALLRSLMAGRL